MTDIIQRVTEVTYKLSQIAQEGYDLPTLTKIWADLPIGDSQDVTFLEAAGQCILEVSNLVDKRFPDMSRDEKTAKKFKLMSALLSLKADQLHIG